MTQTARTFRIFVSSTFSDLKAERNALQAHVFPRLRELAENNNYRLQVIDLRWGVSEEASLDQQAMNICLGEVKRCQQISPRPNFIVLLGDRYGWLPPSPQINAELFDRLLNSIENVEDRKFLENWYVLDENAVPAEWLLKPRKKGSDFEKYSNWQPVESRLQKILSYAAQRISLSVENQLPFYASATEQEISAGAEKKKDSSEHVACFFRTIDHFPEQFDANHFLEHLEIRLHSEHPNGISDISKQHLVELKNVEKNASAKKFAEIIYKLNENTSKNTPEKEILGLINQVLVDFTGKDFVNLVENEWIVDRPALEKQNQLKQRLISKLQQNVVSYKATWTGEGINTEHIDQLCEDVYSFLERIILDEIKNPHIKSIVESKPSKITTREVWDSEGLAHHAFAEERLNFFVGRTKILEKIDQYIQSNENHVLGIVGAGGTGKSALIAKAVEETQTKFSDAKIVFRFIGATPPSSDGRNLLEGLCKEISRCYGESETDIPIEYKDLIPKFHKILKLAKRENPLYLFIDSLDQLSNNHGARNLNWLPAELPENVKFITTTREEDTYEALQDRTTKFETLIGLSREEGEVLLGQWLGDAFRTLQKGQMDEILNKFMLENLEEGKNVTAGNPLYLKLAFEEARLWKSFTPVKKLIPGIHGIIKKNMFDRLMNESNHGEKLVSHALGYLAASRYGLSEDELVDLLSRDFEVYDWFFKKSYHVPSDLLQRAIEYKRPSEEPESEPTKEEVRVTLNWLKDIRTPPEEVSEFLQKILIEPNGPRLPIVLWSRLSFDLAPYLSERLMEKIPLLNFYHRELGEVSNEVCSRNNRDKYYHERLADYFSLFPRFNFRRLDEQPWNLVMAKKYHQLYQLLIQEEFMKFLWEHSSSDLLSFWSQIEKNTEFNMFAGYQEIIKSPGNYSEYTVLTIVRILSEFGYLKKISPLLDYLIEIYQRKKDPQNLQIILGYKALLLQNTGKLSDALELYRKQADINKETYNLVGLSQAIGNQAVILQMQSKYNEAYGLLKDQELLCNKTNNRKGLAISLGNQALILQSVGKLEQAMSLHKKEKLIYQEMGDNIGLARSLFNQARILFLEGRIKESMEILEYCATLAHFYGDTDLKQKIMGNKAEINIKIGDFETGMKLAKEQEKICRELGNNNDLIASLGNQGVIFLNSGDNERAMILFSEIEGLCRKSGNLQMLGLTLNNKASILNGWGKVDEVLEIYNEIEEISRNNGQIQTLVLCLTNQAITYYRHNLRDLDSIKFQLFEAMTIAKEYGYISLENQVNEIIKRISKFDL